MPLSDDDWRDREVFLLALLDLQRRAWDAHQQAADLRTALNAQRDSIAAIGDVPDALAARADSVDAIAGRLRRLRSDVYRLAGSFNGNGVRQGSLYPPTHTHRQRMSEFQGRLERELEGLHRRLP